MSARGRGGGSIVEAATVFIVAASDVVRAGLEALVESDARFTVVGSAADLSEFAAQLSESIRPGVVVFDFEGQGEHALDALRAFVDETDEGGNNAAFVIIGSAQGEAIVETLRAGVVRALLPRAASGGVIVAAVEAVSAGLFALDAETFATLLPPPTSVVDDDLRMAPPPEERSSPGESKLDALTPREREVLGMLAEGLSNKEIAWRLKISEHTVKFHAASIFAKLGVSTRTEAVMQGIRRGLVMM